MKDKYGVVVCPNCEFVRVVELKHKTSKCGRCGKQSKMKKLKKFATSDSMEKMRLVASELRAKQRGEEDAFFEAYESGELDGSKYSGVSGNPLSESEDEEDDRSDREIIEDAIEDCEPATRDNIIAQAVEDGLSEDEADELLSKLRYHTEIMMKSDGTFRVI